MAAVAGPSSSLPASVAQLSAEISRRKSKLLTEIDDADDPLALYDQLIKWIIDKYPADYLPSAGLLELLEEGTRRFKDDPSYRSDLRYLQMWIMFASLVDRPSTVFKFMLSRGIGIVYAALYVEYALVLERDGNHSAVEDVFKAAFKRKARPQARLKERLDEFRTRIASKPPAPPPKPSISLPKTRGTLEADILRRQPLKYHDAPKPSSLPSEASSSSSRPSSQPQPPSMHAPPASGRRQEKLEMNLSLLFTESGMEYSMPEARARSMGLLGKKWAPPPASEFRQAGPSTVPVDFNDDGHKTSRNFAGRKSLGVSEPTVTINTKEALADVFGMYNSPEKSIRFATMPGSKHAPVRKIEPVTPMTLLPQIRPNVNENANIAMKTPTFKPFVDENLGRKENPSSAKFKPFMDSDMGSKTPAFTPDPGRRALSLKESAVTPIAPKGKADETPVPLKAFKPPQDADERSPLALQKESNVFRPLAQTSENDLHPKKTTKFVPFSDAETPFRVPSNPSEQAPKVASVKSAAFKPFVDTGNTGARNRPVFGVRQPQRTIRDEDHALAEEGDMIEAEELAGAMIDEGVVSPTTDAAYEEDDFDGQERSHNTPFGGRFGKFDVLTPITERTYEFTSSSRVSTSDGDGDGRIFGEPDAVEAAHRLAAEVRAEHEGYDFGRRPARDLMDEDDASFVDDRHPPPFRLSSGHTIPHIPLPQDRLDAATGFVEEKTGALSLDDALAVISAFNPPNPCNPFDPPIIATLLSLLPVDNAHHDMPRRDAKLLDGLQKFARKQGRKSGGNSTSTRMMDEDRFFPVTLGSRRFEVYEKLGEGGFGAVFAAEDVSAKAGQDAGSDDEFDEDDEDGQNKVALKVVKPRNLWEFHVLRKIHSTLPTSLRASIIEPQALYAFHDESFLVLNLCTQGSLLEIINRAGQAGVSQQGACFDELLVVFFTIELLRLLEGLHGAGFIHGDLKIDNCMLRLEDAPSWTGVYSPTGSGGWAAKGIKLIDFGRTIDTRMFPHEQEFIAEWTTDARDCVEMREERAWTYQADYFGLAGIVFCMLYGKYIEGASVTLASPVGEEPRRFKLATPFKRYWQTELWTRLFDILLNPCLVRSDGQLPVSEELGVVRKEMEAWLVANCNRSSNTLKGLLKKVELAVMRGD
ncbi:hypothetical protein OF83DRAFT_1080189 [Amylostereum chailletii]|nr:hypothetical protein OF83DRAFT_1080189 [Amylostereum chailletii]